MQKTCRNEQKTCKNVQKRAKNVQKRAANVDLIKKRASQGFLDPIQNRALSRSVQHKAVYLKALLYCKMFKRYHSHDVSVAIWNKVSLWFVLQILLQKGFDFIAQWLWWATEKAEGKNCHVSLHQWEFVSCGIAMNTSFQLYSIQRWSKMATREGHIWQWR